MLSPKGMLDKDHFVEVIYEEVSQGSGLNKNDIEGKCGSGKQ